MAAKAASSALVVATRVADGGCSPGHVPAPVCPTGTEDGQDRGGARDELHGYAPEDAPPQAAGAQHFAMDAGEDVGEAPATGRPAPLLEVLSQERVQQRTAEQIVDPVPLVPLLHDVVPQMVEQLVDFLTPLDFPVPEQVIEVPKIVCPRSAGRRDLQAHGSYVAWWLRVAPDPFEENHRQPRAVFFFLAKDLVDAAGIMQLLFQHFIDRVVEIRGCGCHDSYAQCILCSSGESGVTCNDKFQQFLISCGRPCDPAAKTFLGARCSVRQWIHVLRQQGKLLQEILVFYMNSNSRPALFFSGVEVATLVVDPGSGLFSSGFAGIDAPRAVFPTIAFTQNGEVCTVYASADYYPWKSEHYFYEHLVLQYFQLCAVSASDFLGALDDEEFFVVEGSGVAGSPGV